MHKALLVLFFVGINVIGIQAQTDSVLTMQAFLQQVARYHPQADNADLQLRKAVAQRLEAKGNFDPNLKMDWNEKDFEDKKYFQIFRTHLNIPTWYGLAVNAGYENTRGNYLNPENKTDRNGLWYLGVEANLLQGLLIDERRTALQQAEVYAKMTANERQIRFNELLFAAANTYIKWQKAVEILKTYEENVDLATNYFRATKLSFEGGEKPAIDTLEAFLIVQDQQMNLLKQRTSVVKTIQKLENFLWLDDIPLALQEGTVPEAIQENTIETVDFENRNVHPWLLEKDLKRDQLQLEERLKREKLKPKLKLKYNPLLATEDNLAPTYSFSDYKLGVEFSMPLFLRSERANLEKTRIKLLEVRNERTDKENTLNNKWQSNRQEQALLQRQAILQSQLLQDYKRMLDAEQVKFNLGESSVFLLNKRQEKYISSQIKNIELLAKQYANYWEALYLNGNLLGRIVD